MEEKKMNLFGWVFLAVSWTLIISVLVYCGYKLISSRRI